MIQNHLEKRYQRRTQQTENSEITSYLQELSFGFQWSNLNLSKMTKECIFQGNEHGSSHKSKIYNWKVIYGHFFFFYWVIFTVSGINTCTWSTTEGKAYCLKVLRTICSLGFKNTYVSYLCNTLTSWRIML